jgi:hypothetical protein
MKWITATDLENWAKRIDARAEFIELVGELIKASGLGYKHYRFPSGDKSQVRGFDGDLDSAGTNAYIPLGPSKWEFGVSKGASKPEGDFTKRTKNTSSDLQKVNVLVLLNLHTWDNPREPIVDFVARLKGLGQWQDVKFIDGAQLEAWLDDFPAIAARYAKKFLNITPHTGITSTDEYWNNISGRFSPPLTESVATCGQAGLTDQLIQFFQQPSGMFVIGTESSEDFVTYVVGAIRALSADDRQTIEAKTLVVESADAARELAGRSGMLLVLTGNATSEAGLLSRNSLVIIPETGMKGRNAQNRIVRPEARALGKALETMGFTEDEAYLLAKECGRSLVILQRLKAKFPMKNPVWVDHAKTILPAILAGAWSIKSKLDKEILTALSQESEYELFEGKIRETLLLQEPPLDKTGDVWSARSQVDAFSYVNPIFSARDQKLLKESAIKVLGKELKKPDPNAPYQRNSEPQDDYSDWLRDGIANILLIIASIAQDGGFEIERSSNQEYVNSIIKALPGWGRSHEIIAAIADQLVTIAEAAPNSFLNALESLLEGDQLEVKKLFSDADRSIFASTSPHTYVLWSLEMLAWDPQMLTRCCILLARLAEIDPGGSTTNRPINSLREILVPWAPNTYASLSERKISLEYIVQNSPAVGWDLVTALLPKSHDSSLPTTKPRMRDVAPREEEVLTYAVVWDFQSFVVKKSLQLAEMDEDKINSLIGHISDFSPDDRTATLKVIEKFLDGNQTFQGSKVWFTLRDEVSRHEYFGTTDWALKTDELTSFKDLLNKYTPKDPLIQFTWLFDDWSPNVGSFDNLDLDSVRIERGKAVAKLYYLNGIQGLFELIGRVKIPSTVIEGLASTEFEQGLYESLLEILVHANEPNLEIISMISGLGVNKFGDSWEEYIKSFSKNLDITVKTALVINWPNNKKTWDAIAEFGTELELSYWTTLNHLPREGSAEDLEFAIGKFLAIGKAVSVLTTLFNRISEVKSAILLQALDLAIPEINSGQRAVNHLFGHYLSKIFNELRVRLDVSLESVARAEYAYIKVLDAREADLVIHDFMAKDPNFYMELFCHLFRGNNQEERVVTEEERNKATISYELISSFRKLPGQNGADINSDELEGWVKSVSKIGLEKDRSEITDQYIGHILAHSPLDPEDNLWPHKSVRQVIEKLKNKQIEIGIGIERFNMRGVYSKGLHEGGQQELAISENYRTWSKGMPRFPRTSSMLLSLAEEWLRYSNEADIEAEKSKNKY